MGGKFKFQVQDSDLEHLFWQCEKHITLSEKKPPLKVRQSRNDFFQPRILPENEQINLTLLVFWKKFGSFF